MKFNFTLLLIFLDNWCSKAETNWIIIIQPWPSEPNATWHMFSPDFRNMINSRLNTFPMLHLLFHSSQSLTIFYLYQTKCHEAYRNYSFCSFMVHSLCVIENGNKHCYCAEKTVVKKSLKKGSTKSGCFYNFFHKWLLMV